MRLSASARRDGGPTMWRPPSLTEHRRDRNGPMIETRAPKAYNFGPDSLPANPMLRVTRLTDYATVVLTVLAARPDEVLSAAELAERAGLEAPTVSKVLKPLAQAGLVEGFRGAHGGYRLTRPAAEISLVEIVEAMEGPLAMTECSLEDRKSTRLNSSHVRISYAVFC